MARSTKTPAKKAAAPAAKKTPAKKAAAPAEKTKRTAPKKVAATGAVPGQLEPITLYYVKVSDIPTDRHQSLKEFILKNEKQVHQLNFVSVIAYSDYLEFLNSLTLSSLKT